jgi:formamidopyrimidine-DNA glycosylase
VPELPDVVVYCERLQALLAGQPLQKVRLTSPFVLRSAVPPISETSGRRLVGVRRIGKRIALELENGLFLVIHLMIAGRLRWRAPGASVPRRGGLAAFDFPASTVVFTEMSKKKRASLHVCAGAAALAEFDRGGLEVLEASVAEFGEALRRENHTLKRALTDPRVLSGIGNAYSDEILHRAQLSPFKQTHAMGDEDMGTLYRATREILAEWVARLRAQVGDGFPEQVTAFRPEMAVHGKYRQPCPRCGKPIQRIVYAENEANYCPVCQTGGKLLADRALSRLLKKNWPRTVEELEERRSGGTSRGIGRDRGGSR